LTKNLLQTTIEKKLNLHLSEDSIFWHLSTKS